MMPRAATLKDRFGLIALSPARALAGPAPPTASPPASPSTLAVEAGVEIPAPVGVRRRTYSKTGLPRKHTHAAPVQGIYLNWFSLDRLGGSTHWVWATRPGTVNYVYVH